MAHIPEIAPYIGLIFDKTKSKKSFSTTWFISVYFQECGKDDCKARAMKKQETESCPKEMPINPGASVIVGGPVTASDTPLTAPPTPPEPEKLRAEWADYYRSLGMTKEAEMIEGQKTDYFRSLGMTKEAEMIEGQKSPAQPQAAGTPETAESLPSLETQSPSSGARSRASSSHSSLSNEGVVEELKNLVDDE